MEGGLRLVVFLIAGLPLVALGLFLGNRLHLGLSALQMQRLVGSILLVSGASLLWRAWN